VLHKYKSGYIGINTLYIIYIIENMENVT